MTDIKKSFLDKIKIGAEQSYKNLAMFPLLSDYSVPCILLAINEASPHDRIGSRDMPSWDYIEQFASVDGQIGAVFLINGKIVALVCCSRPETFQISFIKIVECYAKQAVKKFDPAVKLGSSKLEVIKFMRRPDNFRNETQLPAGMETEFLLSSEGLVPHCGQI